MVREHYPVDTAAVDNGRGGMIALLFTDLVSSTELLQRLGDDAAEDLRRAHFGLLRRAVTAGGGHEVKTSATA
jgi:class 3 adenylate cyclase